MLKCLEIVIFIKSFKNISFTLNQGEIISLFWLSGSGISTILNVLTNLIEPTSGNSYMLQSATFDKSGVSIDNAKFDLDYLCLNNN